MTETSSLRESLVAVRERKSILDAVWLLTLFVLFGAIALPWFLRILQIDLAPVAWSTFGYTLVYLLLAATTDRMQSPSALLTAARLLQLSGILYLGVFWHLVGGTDNPLFLLGFVPPVVASGVLMLRWQPYLAASLSVLVAWGVALAESFDLRWYLYQLGLPMGWLVRSLHPNVSARLSPFPGFESTPAFLFVVLELFVVVQFAVALLSDSLSTFLLQLHSRIRSSSEALEEAQSLFQAVLQASPLPGVLVFADTAQVLQASDRFLQQMLLIPEDLAGKGLLDLLTFDRPEKVRALLRSGGGELRFCRYRVGRETRIAHLLVGRVEHRGTAYAHISFQDLGGIHLLGACLEAVREPLLVIGPDRRLLYLNRAAEDRFDEMRLGMDLAPWPAFRVVAERSRAQESSAAQRPVRIGREDYWASGVAARSGDGAESLTFIRLRSALEERGSPGLEGDRSATNLDSPPLSPASVAAQLEQAKRTGRGTLALIEIDDTAVPEGSTSSPGEPSGGSRVVQQVRGELQASDLLLRVADDAFAVIFPNTALDEASVQVQKIQHRLGHSLDGTGADRHFPSFTASLVAIRPERDAETLLAQARHLLATAKAAGKKRCVVRE